MIDPVFLTLEQVLYIQKFEADRTGSTTDFSGGPSPAPPLSFGSVVPSRRANLSAGRSVPVYEPYR